MNVEKVLLAAMKQQSEAQKLLIGLLREERRHSTEREEATWKRAEVEKREMRAAVAAANAELLKVKVISRGVPQQATLPFPVANGHRPAQTRQFVPGRDDAATP